MRTYKETLGIIKRANGLPLMGANAQGYSQAVIDAYNGGGFNQAPSFVQAPQQPDLSSLSTIGTYLPFLLSAGGLFNSNNTQTQPQAQKQVPAQATQSTQPSQTSTLQGVKNLYSGVGKPVQQAQNLTAANQAVPPIAPSAFIEPAGYRPPVITDLNTASKVPRPQGLPAAPAAPKPLSPTLGMYGLYKPPETQQ